jgi:Zn-dependent protease
LWPTAIHIGCFKQVEVCLESTWLLVLPFLAWSLAVYYFPRNYPVFTPSLDWILGLAGAAASVGLVLVHEAVHLGLDYISRRPPGRVVIGVVSHPECAKPEDRRTILVALCGPAANLVLALLAFWAALNAGPLSRPLEALFGYLAGASALIAFVHLLPGCALDGGQALRALLLVLGVSRRVATMTTALFRLLAGSCMIGAALWLSTSVLTAIWLTLIGVLVVLGTAACLVEARHSQPKHWQA